MKRKKSPYKYRWRMSGPDHETGSMFLGKTPGGSILWQGKGWLALAWSRGYTDFERLFNVKASAKNYPAACQLALMNAKLAVEKWLADHGDSVSSHTLWKC